MRFARVSMVDSKSSCTESMYSHFCEIASAVPHHHIQPTVLRKWWVNQVRVTQHAGLLTYFCRRDGSTWFGSNLVELRVRQNPVVHRSYRLKILMRRMGLPQ